MKSRQLKILIIAKFKKDKDTFPLKISAEESGQEQPKISSLAKVIGRTVAVIDRSQSVKPGSFIKMVQAEIDNSFTDSQLEIQSKNSTKPKPFFKWMSPKNHD
ncbi:MAG: hypothetical protein AAFN10_13610 [Bacteroidota bacterium]